MEVRKNRSGVVEMMGLEHFQITLLRREMKLLKALSAMSWTRQLSDQQIRTTKPFLTRSSFHKLQICMASGLLTKIFLD
jgi:hypothetical protein